MKEWRNEYFDRVDSVSLTVDELIKVLRDFPGDLPVIGTYEGIYGSLMSPVVDRVCRGREEEACNCLVFDVEYEGE